MADKDWWSPIWVSRMYLYMVHDVVVITYFNPEDRKAG